MFDPEADGHGGGVAEGVEGGDVEGDGDLHDGDGDGGVGLVAPGEEFVGGGAVFFFPEDGIGDEFCADGCGAEGVAVEDAVVEGGVHAQAKGVKNIGVVAEELIGLFGEGEVSFVDFEGGDGDVELASVGGFGRGELVKHDEKGAGKESGEDDGFSYPAWTGGALGEGLQAEEGENGDEGGDTDEVAREGEGAHEAQCAEGGVEEEEGGGGEDEKKECWVIALFPEVGGADEEGEPHQEGEGGEGRGDEEETGGAVLAVGLPGEEIDEPFGVVVGEEACEIPNEQGEEADDFGGNDRAKGGTVFIGDGEPEEKEKGPRGDGEPAFGAGEAAETEEECGEVGFGFEKEDRGPDPGTGEEHFGHDGEGVKEEKGLGIEENPEPGGGVAGEVRNWRIGEEGFFEGIEEGGGAEAGEGGDENGEESSGNEGLVEEVTDEDGEGEESGAGGASPDVEELGPVVEHFAGFKEVGEFIDFEEAGGEDRHRGGEGEEEEDEDE